MSKHNSNRVNEKLNDFLVIEDFETFKEFLSLMKKQIFYFKGKLDMDLHSELYHDFLSKKLTTSTFKSSDLISFARTMTNSFKNKKGTEIRDDLEILIGMEFNNVPTPLIYFSKNLLYEIWFATLEIKKIHQLTFEYFHIFILMEKLKSKDEIKNWSDKEIYKSTKDIYKKRKCDSYYILENHDDMSNHYDIKVIKINTHLHEEISKYLYSEKKVSAENVFLNSNVAYKEMITYGPLMLSLQAVELNLEGRYNEAIEKFEEVIEIDSKHRGIYGNWGFSYFKLKKYKEAIKKFEKSIKYEEKIDVYNHWGLSYAKLKKYRKAIKMFKRSIKKELELPESYNNWGLTLNSKESYKKAIKKFKEAIKLKEDYPEAHNNYGMSLVGLKKFEKSIEHFEKALQLKPEYEDAIFNLDFSLKKSKKRNK